MKDINLDIETIETKQDFIKFLEILLEDFTHNGKTWTNDNLQSYLEAVASWTEDMDGYYQNVKMEFPENVNWKVFAHILRAARIYE